MITGYWNEPELNSKSFVQIDGVTFYRTGDIGEYLKEYSPSNFLLFSFLVLPSVDITRYDPVTRNLQVIERSGAVLKLAQGEWVVPTKIENILVND
jgi:long-subunit acyl-CoA synthetase (AMP-forming)